MRLFRGKLFNHSNSRDISITAIALFVCLFVVSCGSSPVKHVKRPSYAIKSENNSKIAKVLQKEIDRHNGLSGFYILSEGLEALSAVSDLANNAGKSIDLQSYIFHDDSTGKLIAHHLLAAADRGIRVRVLLDDMFSYGNEKLLATLDAHPNVEVRLFNPVATQKFIRPLKLLTEFSRINRRMHNKALIIDNQVSIVGGRNIGDAYFMAKDNSQFTDMDVLSIGPVVTKVSESFDNYWNSQWAVPLKEYRGNIKKVYRDLSYVEAREQLYQHTSKIMSSSFGKALSHVSIGEDLLKLKLPLLWSSSRVFADPPQKVRSNAKLDSEFLESKLAPYLNLAKSEVTIVSPYFVPQRRGIQWIRELRNKGVVVTVLTNSFESNDHAIAHTSYQRYRKKLLKLGVNLYEYKPDTLSKKRKLTEWLQNLPRSSMHAKAIIIDNKYVIIGSTNLSPRSRYLNTEVVLVIDGDQFAKRTHDLFAQLSSPVNSYRVMLVDNKAKKFGTHDLKWVTYNKNEGKVVQYLEEPGTWLWSTIGIGVLGILPLDDQI